MSDKDPRITKALQGMKVELAGFLKGANALIVAKRAEIDAFTKAAEASDKMFQAANQKAVLEANKVYAAMKGDIATLVKNYMDIVKKTDGLTSVRPSVAKALDRFALTLDDKSLIEAQTTLKKHRDEVLKDGDKKDKTVAAFVKAMDALIADVG